MGANHPGEIDLLCSIADLILDLLQMLGKHIWKVCSLEGVMKTKAELYDFISKSEKEYL